MLIVSSEIKSVSLDFLILISVLSAVFMSLPPINALPLLTKNLLDSPDGSEPAEVRVNASTI